MAMRYLVTFAATLLISGCASGTAMPDDPFAEMFSGVPAERADRIAAGLTGHPLGSEANPVRVNMPPGQRDYLSRLRCSDNRAPQFERIGSMGMGPYGQIVDGYDVQCPGSSPDKTTLYLDMYHPTYVETQAPPGFTLVQ